MVKSLPLQIKAIIQKNTLCSLRNREILTETVLPLVAAIVVVLKEQLQFLTVFAPIFLGISINASGRSLLIRMVEEKSGRFKETQKIMGLQPKAYTIGWIMFGYAKTMLSTIVLIVSWWLLNEVVNKGDFKLMNSFGEVAGTYFIFACASLNQCLMYSTLFSSPKMASEVTTFVTVLTMLLTFLLFIHDLTGSKAFYILLSIFPTSCISFAYIAVLQPNQNYPSADVRAAYPLEDAATQLAIEAVLYFIFYFYLEQVFPNEYGVAKHPLFFIRDPLKYMKGRKSTVQQSLLEQGQYDGECEADFSSAIYHQQLKVNKKQTVVIRDLVKRFGNFTAVDHLSLNLYENEILCLLGHNGAGKTTTISVLTGLLDKTGGSVRVQGMDLVNNLDQIREVLGICSQRDVLYDEITVEEQLMFMGQVKGMSGQELTQEIQQILDKTLLTEERNKITGELSGGNKRKLSLALALIGGSSVIFLDEPTSGMDAMSRRVIWEILQRIKGDGRSLVLTTHHLDEAEILADRIAIMAAGKLLACGQSDYIKLNFGEGYQLSLTILDPRLSKQDVINLTSKHLPAAQLDPQSSANSLLYLLPFQGKSQLKTYFTQLEQAYKDSVQVNLKMNSLEDAFINIGMDEEKFMQRARKSLAKNSQVNDDDSTTQIHVNNRQIEEQKQIKVPECLGRPAQYIFLQQFLAIFLRKWFVTIRTFSNYVATIIPFAIIVIGTVIINQITISDATEDQIKFLKLLFISLFVIFAFCFNSSLYIALPVLERETNLRYALNVMGCRVLPYWLGTFAFDYIVYYIFVISFIVFSYALNLDFITDYMGEVVFLFSTFGLSYITFSYLAGLVLFKKQSTAMIAFPLLNFFIVYGLPWDIWGVFSFIKQNQHIDGLKYALYAAEIFGLITSPFFTFNLSFQNITHIKNPNPDAPQPIFLSTSPYFYGGMLFVEFVIYALLTVVIEHRNYANMNKQNTDMKDFKKSLRVDNAVLEEETRIRGATDPIKIAYLKKTYESGQEAIKEVTFGIQEKQIFGLLGPNGAGKSTMSNILTSLIPKSAGSVRIFEREVNRNEAEIFMNVGVCPQFDCIWENLTPVEHLYLFGRMKGLSGFELDESVQYFIQTMQLEEYTKRKAGRLSGGNKRKLCVSDALIGGPNIQFFDEPSTGVDPIARRFLWKTLKQGVKLRNSSVMITTHTMDEAESLCDRIAILVNGQFYCLGSPQELRDKFGEGYNITIKGTPIDQDDELLSQIKITFPEARFIDDRTEDTVTVHIPTNGFNFFRAFELLDSELRAQKLLTDFSINQSSLESVFLYFSKQQQNGQVY